MQLARPPEMEPPEPQLRLHRLDPHALADEVVARAWRRHEVLVEALAPCAPPAPEACSAGDTVVGRAVVALFRYAALGERSSAKEITDTLGLLLRAAKPSVARAGGYTARVLQLTDRDADRFPFEPIDMVIAGVVARLKLEHRPFFGQGFYVHAFELAILTGRSTEQIRAAYRRGELPSSRYLACFASPGNARRWLRAQGVVGVPDVPDLPDVENEEA